MAELSKRNVGNLISKKPPFLKVNTVSDKNWNSQKRLPTKPGELFKLAFEILDHQNCIRTLNRNFLAKSSKLHSSCPEEQFEEYFLP